LLIFCLQRKRSSRRRRRKRRRKESEKEKERENLLIKLANGLILKEGAELTKKVY
jgi:hypothetical protein